MKRIISCSDGTWNKPGNLDGKDIVRTNVEKMYNAICSDGKGGVAQIKFYDQGVGTGTGLFDKWIGGLTGKGIDKNIKDIYTFLMLNYEEGDEIYLFGFSRGAYTARSVAGFVRNCGILKRENLHLIDKAYEFYRDKNAYSSPDSDLMRAFKKNYCYTPSVKFIGVWDTVGSLGIPLGWLQLWNKQRYQFHDVTLSSHVSYAYHALAIDERRKLFMPAIWEQSETVMNDPNHKQQLEQRWFVGSHSNVGGGYKDCGLSDLALKWMIKKAELTELCFDEKELEKIKGDCGGVKRNSYTTLYWMWLPIWRKIMEKREAEFSDKVNEPGKKKKIKIETKEVIDESVWERFDKDPSYRPGNLVDHMHMKSSGSVK